MHKENLAIVAITKTATSGYPDTPPFNPPEKYPEYPFSTPIDPENHIYPTIRDLLVKLELDKENFNANNWNPFGCFIKPGNTVIIKPNLVVDSHYLSDINFQSAVTHGSVIRPIIDYTYIALQGKGKIVIADGPIDLTDFEDTATKTGLRDIITFFEKENSILLKLVDLRDERLKKIYSVKVKNYEMGIWKNEYLPGDPNGYTIVDLKKDSEFDPISEKCQDLRSTQLIRNKCEPGLHHEKGKHEYSIAKSILDADVIINVPKLKVHKKTGVTINLKNIIGITVPRYWMPHYLSGLDEFDDNLSFLQKIIKFLWSLPRINGLGCVLIKNLSNKTLVEIGGSNPKNDTLWRTILDINKILQYADKNGNMKNKKQRKFFSVVDGVIGGENNSPLAPSAKDVRMIIGGFDPVAVDYVVTDMMGFDPQKIKMINKAFGMNKYSLGIYQPSEISVIGESLSFQFLPPKNWRGFIEKK